MLPHKFWLHDLFNSGVSQLEKDQRKLRIGWEEEKPSRDVLQSQNFLVWFRRPEPDLLLPRLMWHSLASGMGGGQGGAGDTAVTPSTAFTVFRSSGDDTCVKNSLKVKVHCGLLEADKQGSFVRPRDSCLLDFIGKCT